MNTLKCDCGSSLFTNVYRFDADHMGVQVAWADEESQMIQCALCSAVYAIRNGGPLDMDSTTAQGLVRVAFSQFTGARLFP